MFRAIFTPFTRRGQAVLVGLLLIFVAAGVVLARPAAPVPPANYVAPAAQSGSQVGKGITSWPVTPPAAGVTVQYATQHGTTAPLRAIKPLHVKTQRTSENENQPVSANLHRDAPDPVVQRTFHPFGALSPAAMPTPLSSWDGIDAFGGCGGCMPPDTVGDVGPNNYIQMVNDAFQIFDKSGNSLYGPAAINSLWQGQGGACEAHNDGDPIVLYDPLADRWMMSQFTASNSDYPYSECIAVSVGGDPMGQWNIYTFALSQNDFEDYPHFGIWPDGYYMSMVEFTNHQTYNGPRAFVFDRTAMLQGGNPAMQSFPALGNTHAPFLPADLDGTTPPPAGAPNYFAEINDTLNVYRYHVDWANPANSSFTLAANLTTPAYTSLCPGQTACLPQPGSSTRIDGLGSRMLFRAAYRNFGSYDTLVINRTVDAGNTHAGIRWYQLTNLAGTPSIYQSGTFAPDADNRFGASIAMDRSGNIAVGYSVSSGATYPSIRYAGRLAGDPLGTLAQGETTLYTGSGTQEGGSRWGDYSNLTVDPTDDCTFWYTTEYNNSGGWDWSTRVGSFKFPSCGNPPPPLSTPTPAPGPTNTPVPPPTNTPAPTQTPGGPTATPASCNISYSDVPPNAYFYAPVQYLACHGAISGYADGTFRPYNNTTRGQLAKIIVGAEGWPIDTTGGPHFGDVPETNPFYVFVETAYNRGAIAGYADGTFRPYANVTRGQLSKIIVVAQGWPIDTSGGPHFTDIPESSPFYGVIETAFNRGIISGYADNTFRSGANATRGQIAKIVYLAVTAP